MKVIELRNCGNRAGLFQTEDGAKEAAQKILDGYHELYAELPPEELEDTEPLTTGTLTWEVRLLDHHGCLTDDPNWGWEHLTAVYGRGMCFSMDEVEVGP